MKINVVTEPQDIKEFLELPVRLNKGDKNYIRPWDKDVEEVFDPKKNKLFRHGQCSRWILKNDLGQTIGRVAAFVNDKLKDKDNEQPTGGMGFFECIDDQAAANLLFDTCKKWLQEKGLEAMDGPVNFGDRDKWWGLLVKGFYEPNYCMPYNPSYYQSLFENYGFKVYFEQFTYYMPVEDKLSAKVREKAERIVQNPDYEFKHLQRSQLEKYTEDFRTVYNLAWGKHAGVAEMKTEQARNIMKAIKPIMDEKLVWFGYHKGEPVAFYIMLPEINQIVKKLDGQFGWWSKLKFLYYQKTGACKKIFGVVFGVVPEFQGKGVEAAIVVAYSKLALAPGYPYTELEMNWIGGFNPKMMRVAESVGGEIKKVHHTYRKLFDETKEFKPMKTIA